MTEKQADWIVAWLTMIALSVSVITGLMIGDRIDRSKHHTPPAKPSGGYRVLI